MASAPPLPPSPVMAAMNGTLQPRHLAQVVGDGFRLSALLRTQSGIGADHVDQRDDRTVPLLGELHEAQRLAVALRIGLAEIAINPLLGVAALLRAQHGDFASVETRHAANHGSDRRQNCGLREFR